MSQPVRLFVGNLPPAVKEAELKELFERYGKVKKVKIVNNYAHVYMRQRNEAKAAITALDGLQWDEMEIQVEFSSSQPRECDSSNDEQKNFRSSQKYEEKREDLTNDYKRYDDEICEENKVRKTRKSSSRSRQRTRSRSPLEDSDYDYSNFNDTYYPRSYNRHEYNDYYGRQRSYNEDYRDYYRSLSSGLAYRNGDFDSKASYFYSSDIRPREHTRRQMAHSTSYHRNDDQRYSRESASSSDYRRNETSPSAYASTSSELERQSHFNELYNNESKKVPRYYKL